MKKTLYSFLMQILLYASNLFRFFARATVITHTAFDWLFRHALSSIKTSTSFLKGSNRGIANHKYAVSIAY